MNHFLNSIIVSTVSSTTAIYIIEMIFAPNSYLWKMQRLLFECQNVTVVSKYNLVEQQFFPIHENHFRNQWFKFKSLKRAWLPSLPWFRIESLSDHQIFTSNKNLASLWKQPRWAYSPDRESPLLSSPTLEKEEMKIWNKITPIIVVHFSWYFFKCLIKSKKKTYFILWNLPWNFTYFFY